MAFVFFPQWQEGESLEKLTFSTLCQPMYLPSPTVERLVVYQLKSKGKNPMNPESFKTKGFDLSICSWIGLLGTYMKL